MPLCALSMVVRQPFMLYVLFFSLGLCYVGRYYGAFIIITEYVDQRWRNALSTYLLAMDQVLLILVPLYFKYSKADCLFFETIWILINIIAVLGVFWLPESPEYLHGMYKYQKCKLVFYQIAQINKISLKKAIFLDF